MKNVLLGRTAAIVGLLIFFLNLNSVNAANPNLLNLTPEQVTECNLFSDAQGQLWLAQYNLDNLLYHLQRNHFSFNLNDSNDRGYLEVALDYTNGQLIKLEDVLIPGISNIPGLRFEPGTFEELFHKANLFLRDKDRNIDIALLKLSKGNTSTAEIHIEAVHKLIKKALAEITELIAYRGYTYITLVCNLSSSTVSP